jgi:hypothetical protein
MVCFSEKEFQVSYSTSRVIWRLVHLYTPVDKNLANMIFEYIACAEMIKIIFHMETTKTCEVPYLSESSWPLEDSDLVDDSVGFFNYLNPSPRQTLYLNVMDLKKFLSSKKSHHQDYASTLRGCAFFFLIRYTLAPYEYAEVFGRVDHKFAQTNVLRSYRQLRRSEKKSLLRWANEKQETSECCTEPQWLRNSW